MSKNKNLKNSSTDELNGPMHLASIFEAKLTARLATILERRHIIKGYFGDNDGKADAEINKICVLFSKSIGEDLKELISESYQYRRYVKAVQVDSWKDNVEIVLKDTIPFAKVIERDVRPTVVEPPKKDEINQDYFDFGDLFGKKK